MYFLLQQHKNDFNKNENAERSKKATQIVLVCDRGLIMGSPLMDNPLHRVASLLNSVALGTCSSSPLCKKLLPMRKIDDFDSSASFKLLKPLDSLISPSLDTFLLTHMKGNLPIKLLNIVAHWPALEKWNFDYLIEIAGARTVPIEIGSRYTDNDWSQVLLTLRDYITTYIVHKDKDSPIGYLAQHQLFDQIPELKRYFYS